jgi:hypothetical protein
MVTNLVNCHDNSRGLFLKLINAPTLVTIIVVLVCASGLTFHVSVNGILESIYTPFYRV